MINRYKRAYQEFLDLEAGLQSAKNWYSEMRETVESLNKNVETFVNNRRSEGGQLLKQIEQDRSSSKNAQAEVEQQRLRGLMERMSMDPPRTSPQPGPSQSKPTPPALFTQGQGPRYGQATYQNQYQMPSSPPPNQQNVMSQGSYQNFAGQPSTQSFSPPPVGSYTQPYNPSQYGPTPGPTSPPAHQTTFGMNAMRGPASPPPNQQHFGQHQTFPGYGASPAPQHTQTFMPHGYVPPPPPPGPPPLGPQQTMYGGQEGHPPQSAHPQSANPYSTVQQQQHDPWAGLNAWK